MSKLHKQCLSYACATEVLQTSNKQQPASVCIVALPKRPQAQFQQKPVSTYILTSIQWPLSWYKWQPVLACNVVLTKKPQARQKWQMISACTVAPSKGSQSWHKRQGTLVYSVDSPKHLQAQHIQHPTSDHFAVPIKSTKPSTSGSSPWPALELFPRDSSPNTSPDHTRESPNQLHKWYTQRAA